MTIETQAERLAMLADWDTASIAGTSFACVYDEPFSDELGGIGFTPTIDTDRATWIAAGGALGVTVTVTSSTAGAIGDLIAREVRVLADGAMVRVRLETT